MSTHSPKKDAETTKILNANWTPSFLNLQTSIFRQNYLSKLYKQQKYTKSENTEKQTLNFHLFSNIVRENFSKNF
jgi:hypothetical protein